MQVPKLLDLPPYRSVVEDLIRRLAEKGLRKKGITDPLVEAAAAKTVAAEVHPAMVTRLHRWLPPCVSCRHAKQVAVHAVCPLSSTASSHSA